LLRSCEERLGAKRDRTIDFATRPKARPKFLDLLYHQLGGLFRPACIVGRLPDTAWAQPAYRFSPPHEFGASLQTLLRTMWTGTMNSLSQPTVATGVRRWTPVSLGGRDGMPIANSGDATTQFKSTWTLRVHCNTKAQAEHVVRSVSDQLHVAHESVTYTAFKFADPPRSGFDADFPVFHRVVDWEHALLDVILMSRAVSKLRWTIWFPGAAVAHGSCEAIAGARSPAVHWVLHDSE